MATIQDSQWSPAGYHSHDSPGKQHYTVQQGAHSSSYPYQYQNGTRDMFMPVMYPSDSYYQQPQQLQPQSWNYQSMPTYTGQIPQSMIPVPMAVHASHSIPSSPVAWPQSPQFWHMGPGQQSRARQTVPISPQHGPPRRPMQSRYALWVGNIPSHTPILALRDHFLTPETAGDVLSVVFTPASNSGFINFRSSEACKTSMRRFNKAFLYGVPLNCRARKPSMGAGTAPSSIAHSTSPATSLSEVLTSAADDGSDDHSIAKSRSNGNSSVASSDVGACTDGAESSQYAMSSQLQSLSITQGRNRYFIIKSLTYDDLVNSVKSCRWSTQTQNEGVLDDAFKAGDFVYLIFSVNRSREYFGYARMTSVSDIEPAPVVASTPQSSAIQHLQQATKPPIVKVPAAGHIPAGRIIDELCRGKIFWEVDDLEDTGQVESVCASPEGLQKSFAIEWLSLKRIPFRQTMHLRNQLNENKEVKIARDGTELDSEVGRKLCSLFHVPT